MTEIVKLFVQPAASQVTVVDQPMVEGAQALSQGIVAFEKFSYPAVDIPGAGVPFQEELDLDPTGRRLQQSCCEAFVPEIICYPEDLTTLRNCVNSGFQNVTQETRRTIRAAPENLEWGFGRLIKGLL